jgi:hypothetical protein
MNEWDKTVGNLISILNCHAFVDQNPKYARECVRDMVKEIRKENPGVEVQAEILVGVVTDGIRFGQWPWVR